MPALGGGLRDNVAQALGLLAHGVEVAGREAGLGLPQEEAVREAGGEQPQLFWDATRSGNNTGSDPSMRTRSFRSFDAAGCGQMAVKYQESNASIRFAKPHAGR
jgi:bacillopeptidase F (M6 metalloprotease family)